MNLFFLLPRSCSRATTAPTLLRAILLQHRHTENHLCPCLLHPLFPFVSTAQLYEGYHGGYAHPLSLSVSLSATDTHTGSDLSHRSFVSFVSTAQLYEGYHGAYTAQVEGSGEGALAPGALVPAKASFKLAAEVALLVRAHTPSLRSFRFFLHPFLSSFFLSAQLFWRARCLAVCLAGCCLCD